jgi:DNA-binding winged helix-turn-helix (wHTH) protein
VRTRPAWTDVPDTAYRFAQFELQPATRELLVERTPARLGGRAFDVLLARVEERGRTVSRNAPFERAWPGRVVEDQNLRVQINALRRVLGEHAIATIPGRGYRFVLPLDASTGR